LRTTRDERKSRGILFLVALVLLGWTGLPAGAWEPPLLAQERGEWLERAREAEKQGEWLEALRGYDEILRRDRLDREAHRGYRRCLRRFQMVRRHVDPTYRRAARRLTPTQALDVYEQILQVVSASYVDSGKANLTRLFRHGLQELRFALDEENFAREHLPERRPGARKAFRGRLAAWVADKVASTSEARERVLQVVRAAREEGLQARRELITVVSLEFAAGACNALDEYTLFLTPGHFADAQTALEGKVAGVGLDLAAVGQDIEVARVHAKGSAAEAGLHPHDRVVRIDHQPTAGLPAHLVAERLRGEPGTVVEVEIIPVGQTMAQQFKLVRRPVAVASVSYEFLPMAAMAGDALPVGLLRIHHFQESTAQEVKDALVALQGGGAVGIILDLRSNPGGLFKSAVAVANLFLPEGVIVYTRSPFRDYNRPYKAEGMAVVDLPVVVLVDGETASAAELLAGALKDLGRARVVGQTTFGKGSIQCLIPLDAPPAELPGGIRITVAKFFSPTKAPYSQRGVTPTDPCPPDAHLALQTARRLLAESLQSGMMVGMEN
jgi:carboxyl-terminal processing protease